MAEDSEGCQELQLQKVIGGAGKSRGEIQSEHQRNGQAVSTQKAWTGFQHWSTNQLVWVGLKHHLAVSKSNIQVKAFGRPKLGDQMLHSESDDLLQNPPH